MPGCDRRPTSLDDLLHVPQVVEEVGQDDDVEGTFDRREVVRVPDVKRQPGMARGAPALIVVGREVDADAARRPDGGEEVAGAAAQLEHALSGGHLARGKSAAAARW